MTPPSPKPSPSASIATRRAAAAHVLERGIARGELRSDLNVDIAIDAIYYRFLGSHAPIEPPYADTLLEEIYRALAAPSTR